MVITRTPFRVSFFGGGSDIPAFYKRAPGAVLSTTIDKYMYLSVHPYFDGKSTLLKYSRTEMVEKTGDIHHPIVRRTLERLGLAGGIEITSTADVPAGTGLGSSSAFTVGLLNLLYAYAGRHVSPARLAAEACDVEIHDLGAPIGKQDQYAAAFGGLNFIRFFPDESVDVTPLTISATCREQLEGSLLMFYTGEQRSADQVLAVQSRALLTEQEKFEQMGRLAELAWEAKALLEAGEVPAFGRLLHDAWELKRAQAAGISNRRIDDLYARARDAGAWGGKILGAGGGGFLLVAAPPAAHDTLRAALPDAPEFRVRFERGGSKVVYMSE